MSYQQSVYRHQGWGTIGSYLVSLIFMYIFFSASADAFQYLGFPPLLAVGVMLLSILTSSINIPVKRFREEVVERETYVIRFFGINYRIPLFTVQQPSILAINVGGAIIPVIVSVIIWILTPVSILPSIIAIIIAAPIINHYAKPIEGLGIAIPIYIPVSVTIILALLSSLYNPAIAPVVAYTTGVLGSLIGADVMNMRKVEAMKAPIASIGGAGTFDGIFIAGVFSVVFLAIFGIY